MPPTKPTRWMIASQENVIKEIDRTGKRGYSFCDRELSMDFVSLGAPLHDVTDHFSVVISVSLKSKDKDARSMLRIIGKLIEKGELISRAISYRSTYPPLQQ